MTAIFRKYLSRKQLTKCESATALLAPELAGKLYFVNLPVAHPDAKHTMAFAATGRFSYEITDAIKAAGLWQGPRPMIVFCRKLKPAPMLGILLHELAHLLPYQGAEEQVEASESDRKAWSNFVAARFNRGIIGESPTMPAWYAPHGLAFIRSCLHLHARTWHHGLDIGLPEIQFAGFAYDLSPPWRYMHAIGDEPQRMLDADFAEIEKTTAPAEFYQLFAEDFHDWCGRRLDTVVETELKTEKENVSDAA